MDSITSKYNIVRLVGLAALLVLVLVVSSPVGATSGTLDIYEDTILTEDHYGSVYIRANGVTMDCAGHTISDGWRGITLNGRTGVTIQNCRVTNFTHGILLEYSPDNQLIGNEVFGNSQDGIRLNYSSNRNLLVDNISKNNGRHGFAFQTTVGNVISMNEAINNGEVGIALNRSSDTVLSNNTANNNGTEGISLWDSADNTLEENIYNMVLC